MRFVCPSRLQHHQRTHGKAYPCPHGCPATTFATWTELVAHNTALHATHCCDVCGKAFQKAEHLQRHELTHTRPRAQAHVCQVDGCGKTYTSAYNLGVHVRSVHELRGFGCTRPNCGKVFAHKVTGSDDRKKEGM